MNLKPLFINLMLFAFCSISAIAQQTVSGIITDSASGKPLQSVTVIAKGFKGGTQTSAQGKFTLNVPANANTLVISSVGYASREVAVNATLNISLAQVNTSLNDVVVIGYGATRRKDLTGSIATVGQKDFQKGTITSPEQLISGKVAGVQVISNSGQPGAGSTIRIRGGASLNATNDPLIVIDGIPLSGNGISGVANPLATINPNDIESFTILKDAASTAIYGSRASNGVILITTKKGTRGKPQIFAGSSFSVGTIAKKVEVLSGDAFRNFINTSPYATDASKALLGTSNTDWQKQIYHNAITSDNNISISGSAKNLPYRISVGYLSQQGILKTDKIDRGTASIGLSPSLFDNHLKIDINVKGTYTESHFANQAAVGSAVTYDPTQPVYDSKGGYFEWRNSNGIYNALSTSNPAALLNQFHSIGKTARSFGNAQFDYKVHFLPDLHVHLNLGYDAAYGHGNFNTEDSSKQSNSTYQYRGTSGSYKQYVNNTVGEFYLNYLKDITSIKGNINAVAGYGYYNNKTSSYSYPTLFLNGDTVPNTTPTLPLDIQQNTLISYYGRLIYTQSDKYILAGSIRTDGSSRFAKDNRWSVFPSGAFTWRINREDFLKNSATLSDLKLRLSYGITGQQNLSTNGMNNNNYLYLPAYYQSQTVSEYQLGSIFYPLYTPVVYAADIKWEQTEDYNIGLDFGLIKNRITGSIDFYKKKTKDLLNTFNIPVGTNFSNVVTDNIGNMDTKGFEFQLNVIPVASTDFQWSFSYNLAYNKRTITKLSLNDNSSFKGNTTGGISGATGQTIQIQSVGYSPNSFFVYKQLYDSKSGLPIEGLYADLNRDGVINDNDRYHYKSPFAPVIMGFTNTFNYKNWSLNTVLRANIGNYLYNNIQSNLGVTRNIITPNNFLENAPVSAFNINFYNNQFQSDYYIQNASFLKMDNIGLNYDAGDLISKRTNLFLGINCQNVFVVTKYIGNDPEIYSGIDSIIYPRPRTYTLSVNLKF